MMKYKVKFMNMMLTGKLLVVYIVAVMLPTSLLAGIFYQSNLRGLEETYYENQKNALLTAKENLTISLDQITAANNYYQNSDTLLLLLSGAYADVSNTLFYYIRDVLPLLKATRVNPHIQDIYIYGYGKYAVNMEKGLTSIEYLDKNDEFVNDLHSTGELWEFTVTAGQPQLCYYHNIYINSYPYNRGILMFTIDLELLLEKFALQVGRSLFFQLSDGIVVGYENGQFNLYEETPHILNDEDNQVYTLSFSDNFPDILVPIMPMEKIGRQNNLLLVTFLIMVIVFTAFYFLLNISITSRLRAFAAYLNASDEEELTPFESCGYQDEVGIVITSYNELVRRTNSLINENLRAQISQRESDYYALQAQIQPHFLYNVLENIRMNAEANQDLVTADMLQALGKHMRYTLNMNSSPIWLEEELYFARNYLQIYKIRMKNKIQYEVLISSEIDDVRCPKFLLQPLLENALHHAFRLDRRLHIQVLVSNGNDFGRPGDVRVDITDDGNGIPAKLLEEMQYKLLQKQVETSRHVGLLNVNSRLASFLGSEKGCIFLESQEEKGTRLYFYLCRTKNMIESNIPLEKL